MTEKRKRGRPPKRSVTASDLLEFASDDEEPEAIDKDAPDRDNERARFLLAVVPTAFRAGLLQKFNEASRYGIAPVDALRRVVDLWEVAADFKLTDPQARLPGQRGFGRKGLAWVQAIQDLVARGAELDEAMRCAEEFWRILKNKNERLSEVRGRHLPPSFRILEIYGNGDWLSKVKKIENMVRENIRHKNSITR